MVDLASLTKDNIDFNSIKVRLERVLMFIGALSLFYFNSIKVRLELSIYVAIFIGNEYFNSIKVRLERSSLIRKRIVC